LIRKTPFIWKCCNNRSTLSCVINDPNFDNSVIIHIPIIIPEIIKSTNKIKLLEFPINRCDFVIICLLTLLDVKIALLIVLNEVGRECVIIPL